MNLGIDFIIYSLLASSSVIPLYIYRKKVFKFLYKPSDFEEFIAEVKKYLNISHPVIKFSYSIVENTKEEENPKTRQILIVENLLNQFCEYEMFISTQHSVEKSLLWQTYEIDSLPKKDKLPKDWLRRKDTAWKRDHCKCKRCGSKIKMNDTQIYILKEIENGGTYHFENLLTTCNDCYRILNSEDIGKISKSLHITDTLMNKIL